MCFVCLRVFGWFCIYPCVRVCHVCMSICVCTCTSVCVCMFCLIVSCDCLGFTFYSPSQSTSVCLCLWMHLCVSLCVCVCFCLRFNAFNIGPAAMANPLATPIKKYLQIKVYSTAKTPICSLSYIHYIDISIDIDIYWYICVHVEWSRIFV